jgi:hypothetical protein
MGTFLEKPFSKGFINEKLLEEQLEDIKQQLERLSLSESVYSSAAEDFCMVEKILSQSTYTKEDLLILGKSFFNIASGTSDFIFRHRKKIPNERYEELQLTVSFFVSAGKLYQLIACPISDLKSQDSLRNLKKWRQLFETYAELIDGHSDFPLEFKLCFQKLCIGVIDVTSNAYLNNPKKEKQRRLLRNSAAFILQWLKNSDFGEVKNFTVGSVSREKLLQETKSRLHLLDLLSPSNNEEATEHRKTRQHLLEVLGN